MVWFRLDDKFHSNPKIMAAGNEATGLYVRCGSYAAEHLTDGYIPEQIAAVYGTEASIETLVRTKLWRRRRGGYVMRDFLDFNPSKEAVDKERKQAAERQRRRREDMASRRDSAVTHTTPTRPEYVSTGSHQRAGPSYPQAGKPVTSSSPNGAATRQPPPFAEANRAALHPKDEHR